MSLPQQLVRVVICGSVDDGKSTLLGRMLYETNGLLDDHLSALAADSGRYGTRGKELDFALVADGLAAEREQGITIDVAYRYLSTATRRYLIADTPGHEQYTRNMVTGASTADVAVILVDVRNGMLTQTHRHCALAALMGVRHVFLAVNKMDASGYSEAPFRAIESEARAFARRIGLREIGAIPVSAVTGENLISRSGHMPWYAGPTLLEALDATSMDDTAAGLPFRFPVQWVIRPNADFRGYAGTVASGRIRPGDRVRLQPSGREAEIEKIVTRDGDLREAVAGQSVTLTLTGQADVSRGDLIADAGNPPAVADQFEATIMWMGEEPLLGGRGYLMKIGALTATAVPSAPKYRIDVNSLEHLAAKTLEINDIGVCNLALDRSVPFDAYSENRETGGFILIDRLSNETVGAGLLHFALRRSHNIHVQAVDVDRAARARQKGQRPAVVWLTGLSGAGKSTIANLLDQALYAQGRHSYLLDGDNVRHGLNRDLGFTAADRVENVRRVAEVSRLLADAGLIVIVSLISPYRQERRMARGLFKPGEFVEVFVDVPLEVAEQRDPKGLYRKARRGELKNFTGIDAPYEPPEHAELHLDTALSSAPDACEKILEYLRKEQIIGF